MTARLKPDVNTIAQLLADGTYKRAGYLAHTKLSYVVDKDYYDEDEDLPIGVKDRYKTTEGARK